MKVLIILLILISKTTLSEVINVDNKKLKKLMTRGIPIIDVRTEKEWKATGILKKSYLISMINDKGKYSLDDWFKKFSQIKLKNNSIEGNNITIYNLRRGILHWIEKNNPVLKYF